MTVRRESNQPAGFIIVDSTELVHRHIKTILRSSIQDHAAGGGIGSDFDIIIILPSKEKGLAI